MIEAQNIEQMLDKVGICVTGFSGTSMMPMLNKDTDRALIVKPKSPLKPGDIVLYRRDDIYILHRILKINGEDLIIRGDNCIALETQYKIGDVIGVLGGFWRNGTFIECTEKYSQKFAKAANRTYLRRRIKSFAAALKNKIVKPKNKKEER